MAHFEPAVTGVVLSEEGTYCLNGWDAGEHALPITRDLTVRMPDDMGPVTCPQTLFELHLDGKDMTSVFAWDALFSMEGRVCGFKCRDPLILVPGLFLACVRGDDCFASPLEVSFTHENLDCSGLAEVGRIDLGLKKPVGTSRNAWRIQRNTASPAPLKVLPPTVHSARFPLCSVTL